MVKASDARPATTDVLTILFEHNAWAMRLLIEKCRPLTQEQMTRRFAVGPGSINETLLHIISAMRRWSDRIMERPLRERLDDQELVLSVDELLAAADAADRDLRDAAQSIRAADKLGDIMAFTHEGETYHFSRITAFVHALTHGVYHRAQIVNMRRQLGLPPLGFDLDPIECECAQTGQFTA